MSEHQGKVSISRTDGVEWSAWLIGMAQRTNPKTTRRVMAAGYAAAISCGANLDWRAVNQAIIDRWSYSGLQFVKKQAWTIVTIPEGANE